MSAHALLNLLNKLGEKDKRRGFAEHLIGFPQRLISSILQEHECKILFIIHV